MEFKNIQSLFQKEVEIIFLRLADCVEKNICYNVEHVCGISRHCYIYEPYFFDMSYFCLIGHYVDKDVFLGSLPNEKIKLRMLMKFNDEPRFWSREIFGNIPVSYYSLNEENMTDEFRSEYDVFCNDMHPAFDWQCGHNCVFPINVHGDSLLLLELKDFL